MTDMGDFNRMACKPCAARHCARIAELEAVIDKLPKTADGVEVVPGVDTVWVIANPGSYGEPIYEADVFVEYDDSRSCDVRGQVDIYKVPFCYSTREAAEAAKDDPS